MTSLARLFRRFRPTSAAPPTLTMTPTAIVGSGKTVHRITIDSLSRYRTGDHSSFSPAAQLSPTALTRREQVTRG